MRFERIMVEVTGLEPAASWSQTTRATNCATPRSYNLSIIIHKRCGRQVPARQKSYSQAEQPQHQQVRGVEGIEEPLVKRAPAGGAPAVVQVQDHKRGDKDRHSAADGLPHLPGGQKDVRNVVDKHGEHGNHLDGITGHGKNPFRIHCKVRGSGRQDCSGTATFLRPALSFALCLRYNEVQESYRAAARCSARGCRTFLCAGHLLCAGVCDRAVCVRYYD